MAIGQIAGDQTYSKKCHEFLEQVLGVPKAMVTTSCTHALEMCALLLNIQPGDEVIVPSFTFVSTANAFALRGARMIFADIRPDTLNLDEQQLEGLDLFPDQGRGSGALCRGGLRDGFDWRNCRPSRLVRGGRQCARIVRQVSGPLARHIWLPGDPEFS